MPTELTLVEDKKVELKKELMTRIGEAQAVVLLQPTPTKEIRKRLMNPRAPKSSSNPEFSYVEQAYVSEVLDIALFMDWDLIITKTERIGEEALVEGYLECRFKNGMTIKKHGFGGHTHRNNPNLTWGDTFKAAASDLLKNCAARMGIARDLYRSDDERTEKLRDIKASQFKKQEAQDADELIDDALKTTMDSLKIEYNPEITTKGEARELIAQWQENNKKKVKK